MGSSASTYSDRDEKDVDKNEDGEKDDVENEDEKSDDKKKEEGNMNNKIEGSEKVEESFQQISEEDIREETDSVDIEMATTDQLRNAIDLHRDELFSCWSNIAKASRCEKNVNQHKIFFDFDEAPQQNQSFLGLSRFYSTSYPSAALSSSNSNNTPIIRTALLLLDISDELKRLRFKIVPSKMKESEFWAGIFSILKLKYATEINKCGVDTIIKQCDGNNSDINKTCHHDQKLQILLKEKDDLIIELKSRIEEMKKEHIKQQQQQTGSNVSATERTIDTIHKGTWVISKDSADFLEMDDELKQNLRREKQKRLKDVLDEMKFILDSDKVCDTIGEW
eukprot:CAMPEP_0194391076 /NCGR_PEP_ID=MMETSP0174-20130528/113626_1 /TAXON_ID=216777 /ORGANISM="Proboscia alata, Strain PI-D3" /LENGTH=335 /DNA_ID=CAMNT_0039185059 /DNA_START=82 /DNA_END=1086 /DNA_ORIENTATION=-